MDSDSDSDRPAQEPKQKSRKPPNTALRQQRLRAWQPILTPKSALPIYFCIAIVFAVLGAIQLYASSTVQELIIDYSQCENLATTTEFSTVPAEYVKYHFDAGKEPDSPPQWRIIETNSTAQRTNSSSFGSKRFNQTRSRLRISESGVGETALGKRHTHGGLSPRQAAQSNSTSTSNNSTRQIPAARNSSFSGRVIIPVERSCEIMFDIPTNMGPPVYMFYRLSNFYQNHRRYVASFSEKQLNGKAVSAAELKSDASCKPLITNEDGVPYYPCGLIANSLFNDTFSTLTPVSANSSLGTDANSTQWFRGSQRRLHYNMTAEGISWSTDKDRFKRTTYNASDVVPPPNWAKMFPDGYTDENMPDIASWEALQNWMRTSAMPTFSKLARRNDNDVLEAGTYLVNIGLNFPVLPYNGTKSVVLTTRSALGGRNSFLGVAYIAVAAVALVLGLAFLIKNTVSPRRVGDESYFSWNNEAHQTVASLRTAKVPAEASPVGFSSSSLPSSAAPNVVERR